MTADRPLQHINKKGRPVSQCGHCRAMRKSRSSHVKCDCGEKTHKCIHLQQPMEGHKGKWAPAEVRRIPRRPFPLCDSRVRTALTCRMQKAAAAITASHAPARTRRSRSLTRSRSPSRTGSRPPSRRRPAPRPPSGGGAPTRPTRTASWASTRRTASRSRLTGTRGRCTSPATRSWAASTRPGPRPPARPRTCSAVSPAAFVTAPAATTPAASAR
jgi:hypothetical protein